MLQDLEQKLKLFSQKYSENTPQITYDKSIIRWGKKLHLWASAHRWEYGGEFYAVLYCGTWRDPQANEKHLSWSEYDQNSKNFHKKASEEMKLLELRLEHESQKKHKECSDKWINIFKKAQIQKHGYLDKKGVDINNARVSGGTLLIPLKDMNGFTGCQMIFFDEETSDYQKRFSKGIKLKGSISALKDFKNAEYCYLSEGFATAATIQKAYPNVPSIMSVTSANMPRAIDTIREENDEIKIIIAADNDKNGVGKKYAEIAKRKFKNVAVKLPKFELDNPSHTDFNDLANAQSIEEVKKQLRFDKSLFQGIIPLGVNNKIYYYTTDENPQMMSLGLFEHRKAGFKGLISRESWWQANYGYEDKDGRTVVNWENVRDDLIGKCHENGVFTPSNVRGLGLWLERKNNYIINNGRVAINQPDDSKFYYIKKRGFDLVKNPDVKPAYDFCKMLRTIPCKKPIGNAYLIAWWVQSHIFPVLNWRFHLWLTGGRGTGKSTILDFLKNSSNFIRLVQDTTAAGLRQRFESDMTAILYDEAEPTNIRVPGVIDLARESSSNAGAETIRGTQTGKSIQHFTQMNFLFSSIQTPNLQAADKSRFLQVELAKNDSQTIEEFNDMIKISETISDKPLDFFSWSVNHLNYVVDCKSVANKKLRAGRVDARQADTLSTVIACISIFGAEEIPAEESVTQTMQAFDFFNTEYIDETKISDSDLAFDELMDIIVDIKTNDTLAGTIQQMKQLCDSTNYLDLDSLELSHIDYIRMAKNLSALGMRYLYKKNAIFIYHRNRNLIRKMDKYPNFADVLARDENIKFEKGGVQRLYRGNDKSNKTLKGCLLYLGDDE